jgi:hypothetical protein
MEESQKTLLTSAFPGVEKRDSDGSSQFKVTEISANFPNFFL